MGKKNKELELLIQGITAFTLREEALYYFTFHKDALKRINYKDVLQQWNVHDAQGLQGLFNWILHEGKRASFNQLVNKLSSYSYEEREGIIQSMPADNDQIHRYKMIHNQMYRMPSGGVAAFDYCWYIMGSIAGQKLGYIEEKEARSQILYGIRELQRAYSSWTEYIIGFALGRQFEANNTSTEYVRQNKRYIKRILLSKRSPVNLISWNMELPDVDTLL